jgi:hypothetical protein
VEHPFAREAADPPDAPPAAGVRFFSKATADELAATGATVGRLTAPAPDRLGVSADAAAYGCGPAPFMAEVHGPHCWWSSLYLSSACADGARRMPGVAISRR